MSLPSRQDITDRRIGLFKEQIAEALESQDLEFFEELIDSFQSEYDAGHRRIAAALAYLAQKERPLQSEEVPAEPMAEVRDVRPPRERSAEPADAGMCRYRIEVGRDHGVEPRHIVGAITNEANLSGRHVGAIKLFNTFSLVDLPDDMPAEIFSRLQKVSICGKPMQISVDAGGKGSERPEKHPRRLPFKKGGDARPFKPGAKKPPHDRRGPKKGK